jgi:hypothetical protein
MLCDIILDDTSTSFLSIGETQLNLVGHLLDVIGRWRIVFHLGRISVQGQDSE